jgi:hypothetical protein
MIEAGEARCQPRVADLCAGPARRICAAVRRERRGSAGRLGRATSRTAKGPAFGEVWSPEQIAGRMRVDFPHDESMRFSHEAIYQSVCVQGGEGLAPGADRLSSHRSGASGSQGQDGEVDPEPPTGPATLCDTASRRWGKSTLGQLASGLRATQGMAGAARPTRRSRIAGSRRRPTRTRSSLKRSAQTSDRFHRERQRGRRKPTRSRSRNDSSVPAIGSVGCCAS